MRSIVKSIIISLMVLIIAGLPAACGGDAEPNETDTSESLSLRDSLSDEQATQVAVLDGANPAPNVAARRALLIDGAFYLDSPQESRDLVQAAVEGHLPVIFFGDGYDLLRDDLTYLPWTELDVGDEEVTPVVTGVIVYPDLASLDPFYAYIQDYPDYAERPVSTLFQVMGTSLTSNLVTHVLGQLDRLEALPQELAGSGLLLEGYIPTGFAWLSTGDSFEQGQMIVQRSYIALEGSPWGGGGEINPEMDLWDFRQLVFDVSSTPRPGWTNSGFIQTAQINAWEKGWTLLGYGPFTTYGVEEALVNVGDFMPSYSFDCTGTVILNQSSLGSEMLKLKTVIDGPPATLAYSARPAIVYGVKPASPNAGHEKDPGHSHVKGEYQVEYRKRGSWMSPVVSITDYGF